MVLLAHYREQFGELGWRDFLDNLAEFVVEVLQLRNVQEAERENSVWLVTGGGRCIVGLGGWRRHLSGLYLYRSVDAEELMAAVERRLVFKWVETWSTSLYCCFSD